MSDKIENKDLIADDLFKPASKNAAELNTEIERLTVTLLGLKEVAKTIKKDLRGVKIQNVEDINKANEAIKNSKKVVEEVTKVEKDRLKLRQRLKEANSTAIDQNAILKEQLLQQNKVNKQLAKEKLGLIGAYEKESKRLIKLRKQYKDLLLVEGENSNPSLVKVGCNTSPIVSAA